MKSIYTILVILLTIMAGCGSNKKSDYQKEDSDAITIPDTFITIDVSKKYPLKELILQDIMDVEYIALESTDEFLCQGIVQAIGKEIILVKNVINDGDIFIFDRNGKGLRKFNRKGLGSEEYIFNLSAFIDDNSGEIYIDEIIRNVLVYDFQGNFLKSIPRDDNKWINATNYNQDYLIARESPSIQIQNKTDNQRFVIISKQDGNIAKDIRIYFKKKVEWGITNRAGNAGGAPRLYPIVPYDDSWLLTDPSSDTIFKLSPDYNLTTFIARTPSIQSMKPAVFLLPCIFTDRYYFMNYNTKTEYG